MSHNISLEKIERKVFTTAFQDGLWDIFIGCIVLMFAVAPFLSTIGLGDFWSSAVFIPFWALVYLIIWLIKKFVVTPRIGVVKFGPSRKVKMSRFLVMATVVGIVGSILGILSAHINDAPGWVYVTTFGLLVLIGFSVAAYFMDFARLYLYGVLIALSPLVGEWLYIQVGALHHGFPITFGTTAGIIILVGLIKLTLLLRDHPIPKEESLSVES